MRASSVPTMAELQMSERDYRGLRELIRLETGIELGDQKRVLLASRLQRRVRALGLRSFRDYYTFLLERDPRAVERRHMVNAITTNKTGFFREPHHFEFLSQAVIAPLVAAASQGGPRKLRIWSAGCSTGQEPYSIAMTVADALGSLSGWDVRILASDVDTQVLAAAERGEYPEADLDDVPKATRRRWFSEVAPGRLSVRRELKDLVAFRTINFVKEPWPIRTKFDLIFCRNVVIYFGRATQERLYRRFVDLLVPGGYVVAGHSENLSWMAPLLTPVGNTVYVTRRADASRRSVAPASLKGHPPSRSGRAALERPEPLPRVQAAAPPQPRRGRAVPPPLPRSPGPERGGAAPGVERRRVRIQSGQMHSSAEPTIVSTVLGSCVAACLHDPRAGVGGMNHFMLPEGTGADALTSRAYGVNAMEMLINELLELGARRERLTARVFGAGHVLDDLGQGGRVAALNSAFVREFLSREGIPVLEERLGGTAALNVTMDTQTGKVIFRELKADSRGVVASDEAYRGAVQSALGRGIGGGVELF